MGAKEAELSISLCFFPFCAFDGLPLEDYLILNKKSTPLLVVKSTPLKLNNNNKTQATPFPWYPAKTD